MRKMMCSGWVDLKKDLKPPVVSQSMAGYFTYLGNKYTDKSAEMTLAVALAKADASDIESMGEYLQKCKDALNENDASDFFHYYPKFKKTVDSITGNDTSVSQAFQKVYDGMASRYKPPFFADKWNMIYGGIGLGVLLTIIIIMIIMMRRRK